MRRLVFAVVKLSLVFEADRGATILALRWWTGYDYSLGRSIYLGIFHSITAFNNAGFALWTDNLDAVRDRRLDLASPSPS